MKTRLLFKGKNLLAALLLLAALPGCDTAVDLPEPPHTPRIALTYTLSNTAPAMLFVSSSQRIFETRPLSGRDDATVEIRDGQGTVVERFRSVGSGPNQFGPGSYEPILGLRGQPGQTYTLRAAVPGLETAESTLTMPLPPVIESAAFTPRANDPNSQTNLTRGRLQITVADNGRTTDYYLAFARVLDKQGNPGNWSSVVLDGSSEGDDFAVDRFQLSSGNSYGGYGIYPYPDTNVNGQRVSLNSNVSFYSQLFCDPNQSSCPEAGYLEVSVQSITADTYNFYQSQRRYVDGGGSPFAEPAPLASNIRPGYGLFGGAAEASYRVRLF
ncbi:hypothetical protein GCM10022408_15030 [Hymenobacter fastidiosus]|uniref:DUF4249 domain-containing protein n=1 Tax=Hymenobacter fastidiosus TaxID=486264 RepID=A0ABP7RZ10_9BACT